MPSPRRPSRALASRSVTLRADEEFAIAVAAGNGGGGDAGDLPAERRDERRGRVADLRVNVRVADDPFFCNTSTRFELRLDQRQQAGRPTRQRERRRHDEPQRHEAHVDGDELRRFRNARRIERADIGRFDRHDVRPPAQARMQLAATDVDRVDAPGSAGEQDLREAAGRGADVETDAARRIEPEMLERGRELDAAARDPGVRGLGANARVDGDFVRWLGDGDVVYGDAAGGDGSLRLGAAFEQAALDEKAIDASPHVGEPKNPELCATRPFGGGLGALEQVTALCCYFQSARNSPGPRCGCGFPWRTFDRTKD